MPTEEDLLGDIVDGVAELGLAPAPLPPQPAPQSLPAGAVQVSLHTGEPSAFDTREASYAGYARVQVPAMKAAGSLGLQNDEPILFPQCTGGSEWITHLGVWRDGQLMASGPVSMSCAVSVGVRVQIGALKVSVGGRGVNPG